MARYMLVLLGVHVLNVIGHGAEEEEASGAVVLEEVEDHHHHHHHHHHHVRQWYEPAYAEYRMGDNTWDQYVLMMLIIFVPVAGIFRLCYAIPPTSTVGHAFRKCMM